jgi:RimJ/RimL family protein N-acetyltransferase
MASARPSAPARLLRRLSTFRSVDCIVYRHELSTEPEANVEIRAVTGANLEDARAFDPPRRIAEFRSFLARGDRGWYGYVGGRWVHRSWLVHGPAVMRLWAGYGAWPVATGAAYIHYCETTPEARGRNIYPAVLSRIARDTRIHDIFISCESENIPSRRGIEKAGFTEIALVTVNVRFGFGTQSVTRAGT